MKKLLGLLGFACVALVGNPAAADTDGPKGLIWSVQINAPGSSDFSSYRGAIEVKGWRKVHGKKRVTFNKYMWGGSNCPNRDLEDGQITVLATALANSMKIKPTFVSGQLPNTRCLVSFKLFRRRSGGEGGDGGGGGGGGNQPDDD